MSELSPRTPALSLSRSNSPAAGLRLRAGRHAAVIWAATAATQPFSSTRVSGSCSCATQLFPELAEPGALLCFLLPSEDDSLLSGIFRRLSDLSRSIACLLLGKLCKEAFKAAHLVELRGKDVQKGIRLTAG